MTINIIKKNRPKLKLFKKIEYIKIINVAIREDSDEYFDMNAIIIQLIRKINPRLVENTKRIPK